MDLMIVGAATAARLGGGAAGCVRVAVQFGWACGERGIGLPLYYSWLAKAEMLLWARCNSWSDDELDFGTVLPDRALSGSRDSVSVANSSSRLISRPASVADGSRPFQSTIECPISRLVTPTANIARFTPLYQLPGLSITATVRYLED